MAKSGLLPKHYERGWFSSEGQHRIELRDGETLGMLRQFAGPMSADELPVLIINTRLDHGLIPVASMSRDAGSLVPGPRECGVNTAG